MPVLVPVWALQGHCYQFQYWYWHGHDRGAATRASVSTSMGVMKPWYQYGHDRGAGTSVGMMRLSNQYGCDRSTGTSAGAGTGMGITGVLVLVWARQGCCYQHGCHRDVTGTGRGTMRGPVPVPLWVPRGHPYQFSEWCCCLDDRGTNIVSLTGAAMDTLGTPVAILVLMVMAGALVLVLIPL